MRKHFRSLAQKIRSKKSGTSLNSKSELNLHLKEAKNKKIITQDALNMIEGVLSVSSKKVEDIMIPRSKMAVIKKGVSYQKTMSIIIESSHSRFPVISEDKDDVIGILHAKDLLNLLALDEQEKAQKFKTLFLKANLRSATFVPESQQLDTLLKNFKKSHKHLAIVVDEYGGISGIITIEDILEEIVGEIEDEFDIEKEDPIKKISEKKYQIKAITSVEDFNDYFKIKLMHSEVDTIGGIITQKIGAIPKKEDIVLIDDFNFKFTVKEANERQALILTLDIIKNKNKIKDDK